MTAAKRSFVEDFFFSAKGSDPRCDRFLNHLSKTTKQADVPVYFRDSVGGLALLVLTSHLVMRPFEFATHFHHEHRLSWINFESDAFHMYTLSQPGVHFP
jgi:hypothetical protein